MRNVEFAANLYLGILLGGTALLVMLCSALVFI